MKSYMIEVCDADYLFVIYMSGNKIKAEGSTVMIEQNHSKGINTTACEQ